MNEFEIKTARENYKKMVSFKENIEQAKSRISELEKDPSVKEYLELIDAVNKANGIFGFSENEMSHMAFLDVAKHTLDSNRILVYMGAYSQNVLTSTCSLVPASKADFIEYLDLETTECYKIEPYRKNELEQKNKVIYMEGSNQFSKTSQYTNSFYKLQCQFFQNLLNMPQEDAVQKIIKGR